MNQNPNELVNSLLPDVLKEKATPPLPMSPLLNPMAAFDIRTPAQIKEQVEMAKKTADFFRNHWLWFYVVAGITIYRTITATRLNAAIYRIDKALNSKEIKQNPRKRKK